MLALVPRASCLVDRLLTLDKTLDGTGRVADKVTKPATSLLLLAATLATLLTSGVLGGSSIATGLGVICGRTVAGRCLIGARRSRSCVCLLALGAGGVALTLVLLILSSGSIVLRSGTVLSRTTVFTLRSSIVLSRTTTLTLSSGIPPVLGSRVSGAGLGGGVGSRAAASS